jgi:hypothetical protein
MIVCPIVPKFPNAADQPVKAVDRFLTVLSGGLNAAVKMLQLLAPLTKRSDFDQIVQRDSLVMRLLISNKYGINTQVNNFPPVLIKQRL